MAAKELKDYTREELDAEIARRVLHEPRTPEEVQAAFRRAAGTLRGVDHDQLKADIREWRGHDD